ncbi:MAG TPA: DUF748 domain-containing protein [Cyclobacteriaceae bacterium]
MAFIKVTRRRILRAALILVVGAVLFIALGGPIVARILSSKLKSKLEAANVHIGSLSVNLFTRSISIKDINWDEKATVRSAYATGIRLLPFLRHNRISIHTLVLDGGVLDLIRDSIKFEKRKDSTNLKLSGIDADRITVSDIAVTIKHDTVTEYKGTLGVVLHFVALDTMAGYRNPSAYVLKNLEVTVKDLRIHYAGGLYVLRTKQIDFNKELKQLNIDSLTLDPVASKVNWGSLVKDQNTRTELMITKLNAVGVTMGVHVKDTAVMATSVTMDGWYIHCYKNKKYRFNRKERFPLPMESFRSIRLAIEVDTIKLRDGTIIYEELPNEGFHNAQIKFDDVQAQMNSVSNRSYENYPPYSTIHASGRVMKSGLVKAVFKVPLEPNKKYSAEGSIANLPLKELNPLLKDIAFVQVSSGRMDKLSFQFRYDDEGSQGQVHFDYEDLRILSLNKDAEQDVNVFKTMLVNIAVKNDKTLDGVIDVKRFKRKAVFHLWTMSLLDGIRSAIIPKIGEKKKKAK